MIYIKNIRRKIKTFLILLLCLVFCVTVKYKKESLYIPTSSGTKIENANITLCDFAQKLEDIFYND